MAKTCKDCMGYDFCDFEYIGEDDVTEACKKFKDKDRYIELPCKVGDDVYWLKRSPETYDWYIYQGNIYSICALNNTSFFYISPICFFDETDLGKTIFLTREAAEKALKERENNG